MTIQPASEGWLELKLENLRYPGMVSNLNRVLVPVSALRDVLGGGFIQIRVPEGFATLSGGETIELVAKGSEDLRNLRCSFNAGDLAKLVQMIYEPAARAI